MFLPDMFEDDPLGPTLDEANDSDRSAPSSTWIVLGRCLGPTPDGPGIILHSNQL